MSISQVAGRGAALFMPPPGAMHQVLGPCACVFGHGETYGRFECTNANHSSACVTEKEGHWQNMPSSRGLAARLDDGRIRPVWMTTGCT